MKKIGILLLVTIMVFSVTSCNQGTQATVNTSTTPAATTVNTSTTPAATSDASVESNKKDDKAPVIGFAVYDYSNAYMAYVRKGIENYCADGKATLKIVDSANDQTKQNDQVQTLIQNKVDILIVNLVDPGAGKTILDAAKTANIPVCFINRAPNLEILNTWDKSWYVGINWLTPGLVEADVVKADWEAHQNEMDKNKDGILQYVLVQGNISQQDAIYRTQAINDQFSAWNTDSSLKNEQLAIQEAGWNTTKAKELMETWLVKYGNGIEAVVCNNDAMAMGVIEALRGNGYYDDQSKKVWVYGINALPQVWTLLENKELSGTVLTSPWLQATAAIDICIDTFNGRVPLEGSDYKWSGDSGREIRVDNTVINLDNIEIAKDAYNQCS